MHFPRTQVLLLLLSQLVAALPAQVLRFGVIGDSGTGDSKQKLVADRMAAWQKQHLWTLVLMLGDNIYENGNPAHFDEKFREPYKPLLDLGVRFHSTLGNHDRRHPDARLGCAQVADDAFGYLENRDEYVLEEGPVIDGKRLVRVISINSPAWEDLYIKRKPDRTDCRGTDQDRLEQLESWLAESGRYHWNLLTMHHPLYSYVRLPGLFAGHGSSKKLRELLEPRLRNRVDVVFAGHDHFYQRIKPQNGIHYFVSGGASKLRFGGNFGHENVAFGAKRLHFLDIELSRDELKFRAVDEEGNVFDSGSIAKNEPR